MNSNGYVISKWVILMINDLKLGDNNIKWVCNIEMGDFGGDPFEIDERF